MEVQGMYFMVNSETQEAKLLTDQETQMWFKKKEKKQKEIPLTRKKSVLTEKERIEIRRWIKGNATAFNEGRLSHGDIYDEAVRQNICGNHMTYWNLKGVINQFNLKVGQGYWAKPKLPKANKNKSTLIKGTPEHNVMMERMKMMRQKRHEIREKEKENKTFHNVDLPHSNSKTKLNFNGLSDITLVSLALLRANNKFDSLLNHLEKLNSETLTEFNNSQWNTNNETLSRYIDELQIRGLERSKQNGKNH